MDVPSSFPPASSLAEARPGEVILTPGTYQSRPADYGWLIVPENHHDPEAGTIHFPFIRLQAANDAPSEPVFFLRVGLGATNLTMDMPAWVHADHDFVMLGYRSVDGSISSSVALKPENVPFQNG